MVKARQERVSCSSDLGNEDLPGEDEDETMMVVVVVVMQEEEGEN